MGFKNRHARFCSTRCRVRSHRAVHTPRIPVELTAHSRWVRRTVTKRPITATGRPATSTDPKTWTDYGTAAASTSGAGLGFVLNGDGLAVLDLDHCLIDGKPTPAAQRILDRFPRAWVEVSPSGDGLHVWGTAESQPGRKITTADGLQVEFYTRGRYMTVTGVTYRAGGTGERLQFEDLA